MADCHFVYKDVEGTTTEWDEIQRKLGNLPPKPPPFRPPAWEPAAAENARKDHNWIDDKAEEELEDLEDDPDLEDDRFLEEYRKKRLAELKELAGKPRFGSILHISGSDFIREVSNAPPDVWVVVHLYKDGVPECELLGRCLEELATRHVGTKFVKIISTDCIKDYPDYNLPTVLVYNHTNVKANFVGLRHFGGQHSTPEDVAYTLCQVGPVLSGAGSDTETYKNAVAKKASKKFVEKFLNKHEQEDSDDDDHDS